MVTDNNGATDADTVQVTVNAAANVPPTANAGIDQTLTLPTNNTTLDGSASADPDGIITAYAWAKINGPVEGFISNPASAITTITGLVQGVYRFELTVTDNNGATNKDTVQVIVNLITAVTIPPIANAGINQIVSLPANSTALDGSASSDPDGVIVSYQWLWIAGPAQYTIINPGQVKPEIRNLEQGVYQFELKVTDNQGLTDKDTVTIYVLEGKILVKAYPTVVTGSVKVSITAADFNSPATITICNISGNIVYKEQLRRIQFTTNKEIDMSGFISGVYFIEVTIGSKARKVITVIRL
jgi:hypothetical protein